MKNSTAKPSKVIKRTVGGLIFGVKDKETYKSVWAWLKAGAPDNVYVHDQVDTLEVVGIPVCDAVYVRGIYCKIPIRKPKLAEVTIIKGFIQEVKPGIAKSKSKGIQCAETKDHHKMIY